VHMKARLVGAFLAGILVAAPFAARAVDQSSVPMWRYKALCRFMHEQFPGDEDRYPALYRGCPWPIILPPP
jgi:hypothetical protein